MSTKRNTHTRSRQTGTHHGKNKKATNRASNYNAAKSLTRGLKQTITQKLHMSQCRATGDETDRWTTRRRPCPAALEGDREHNALPCPAQRPRKAEASRVGTEVPLNQCLGDAVMVRASPRVRA